MISSLSITLDQGSLCEWTLQACVVLFSCSHIVVTLSHLTLVTFRLSQHQVPAYSLPCKRLDALTPCQMSLSDWVDYWTCKTQPLIRTAEEAQVQLFRKGVDLHHTNWQTTVTLSHDVSYCCSLSLTVHPSNGLVCLSKIPYVYYY